MFTLNSSATNDTAFEVVAASPGPVSIAFIAIRPRDQASFDKLTGTTGTASAQTVPALTPAGADELLVRVAIAAVAGSSAGYTWSSPATEVLDYSADDATTSAVVTISAAIEDAPDSGAADTGTATYSASSSYAAYTVALSPTLKPLGQALETSSTRTMVRQILGQAREQMVPGVATAILTMPVGATAVEIGQALEADTAYASTIRWVIGRAVETDVALRARAPGLVNYAGSRGALMGVGR